MSIRLAAALLLGVAGAVPALGKVPAPSCSLPPDYPGGPSNWTECVEGAEYGPGHTDKSTLAPEGFLAFVAGLRLPSGQPAYRITGVHKIVDLGKSRPRALTLQEVSDLMGKFNEKEGMELLDQDLREKVSKGLLTPEGAAKERHRYWYAHYGPGVPKDPPVEQPAPAPGLGSAAEAPIGDAEPAPGVSPAPVPAGEKPGDWKQAILDEKKRRAAAAGQ